VINIRRRRITLASLFVAVFLLVLVSSSFFTIPIVAAANLGSNNGVVPDKNPNSAGYEIYSSTPGKVISVQANWTVPAVTCVAYQSLQVGIFAAHHYSDDSGSFVVINCNGPGASPIYTIYYMGNNYGNNPLPSGDTISPGDKMYTLASVDILGGETSVYIADYTKGWTFGVSGAEPIDMTSGVAAEWYVASANSGTPTEPLPQFSTIVFSHVRATVKAHTGNIGTFISGFTIYKWIFVDSSTGHRLVKTTSITSSSTSFTSSWAEGS
jgi:hypothetical protein